MEEVVIVIADLYLTSAAEAASIREVELPGLGQIARFGTGEAIGEGWRAWLAAWAGGEPLAGAPPATIAAAAGRAASAQAEGQMVWLATPVHFIAGLSSVHLDVRGLLQVEADVRQSLASEFNSLFADSGYSLEALPSSGFLLTSPPIEGVLTSDPARVLGASINEALPSASQAPALRRLSAEVEMWLHEHPVNQRRVEQGRLPITALWFWGGGTAPAQRNGRAEAEIVSTHVADTVPASAVRGAAALASTAAPAPGMAFGLDPYLDGLWRTFGGRAHAMPTHFEDALAHSGRRAVFVIELSQAFDQNRRWGIRDALMDADQRWIMRALAALRRGDVSRVTVIANDHKLSLSARDRLKLWRMPRPALTALQ
ncbi:MAG: hypothetical protein IRZ28_22255 [Steroidobacteraceae bacterium]|nr:hypothetical protein [Steroidobacteraceae bacterium]